MSDAPVTIAQMVSAQPFSREDVWEALADQFLDTETRAWIPRAASTCVAAGFTVDTAFEIWTYEVKPAVAANLDSVAGEWAGWDREWLVDTIKREAVPLARRRKPRLPDEKWLAIRACMLALLEAPAAEREALTRDLQWLAAHYFDFVHLAPVGPPPARSIYEGVFLPAFSPLAGWRESSACAARVERALANCA